MRKLVGWTPQGAAVRLRNVAVLAVGARAFRHAELAPFDGQDGRPLYFSAAGRVYDATHSEAFRETYPA
eukprot:gene43951-15884_t